MLAMEFNEEIVNLVYLFQWKKKRSDYYAAHNRSLNLFYSLVNLQCLGKKYLENSKITINIELMMSKLLWFCFGKKLNSLSYL